MVMLADLQPDASIDGGPWYNAQNKTFDVEYVNTLRSVAFKLLRNHALEVMEKYTDRPLAAHEASLMSAQQLFEKIEGLNLFTQKLVKEDLSKVGGKGGRGKESAQGLSEPAAAVASLTRLDTARRRSFWTPSSRTATPLLSGRVTPSRGIATSPGHVERRCSPTCRATRVR